MDRLEALTQALEKEYAERGGREDVRSQQP
jgi:hypothetical protein